MSVTPEFLSVAAESGYPRTHVERFAAVVTRHIESLPSDYYKYMREFTENGNALPAGAASIEALGFDFAEDYKKLAPEVLVDKYMELVSAPLASMFAGYDTPEVVGDVDGTPVWFLRAPGQYVFRGPHATCVLSVALTGAFYPPALPA